MLGRAMAKRTCCVVGIFSIGLFLVPAAVLMTLVAAMVHPRPVPAPR
jgi:hypothetical protein